MIDSIDIYRTAKIVLDLHGDRALLEAMERVEQFRSEGNEGGRRLWLQIADAIEWMSQPFAGSGETLH